MTRKILITGAGSGIGAALYTLLKQAGDQPIGLDVKGAEVVCDLTDRDAIAAACADLPGQLDGIAHVAGLPGTADAEAIVKVNTIAPMLLTEALRARLGKGSAIVAVSSVTALRCDWDDSRKDAILSKGTAAIAKDHGIRDGKAAYELSKALLNRWVIQQANALATHNIRINTVSPGPVETPILKDFETSIGADRITSAAALTGRHGQPCEIAQAVRFLLSPQASWINGTDLKVDGGYHALRAMQGVS